MLDVLLDMVLPRACLACGAPKADPFCAPCWDAFPWNGAPCTVCAMPGRAPVCARCRRAPPPYTSARAVAVYAGVARDALMRFKLGGERRAASSLSVPMATAAQEADVVSFVPSTRASVNARGFDPAQMLARAVARRLSLSCAPLLRKTRATKDSSGLGRAERRINLAGAIAARGSAPESVLLVDDIMTTGATAEACATALVQAGARRVHVLTFARTP